MSDGPGGKLVSVTRPSAAVLPRQFVVLSERAMSDGAPRPIKRTGDAGAGLSGVADSTAPRAGPAADETRNVALPATTRRVLTMSAPDTETVLASESSWVTHCSNAAV